MPDRRSYNNTLYHRNLAKESWESTWGEEDGNLDMMNEDASSEDRPGHQLLGTVDVPGPATVEGLALEELDERSNGYLDEEQALLRNGEGSEAILCTRNGVAPHAIPIQFQKHGETTSRGVGIGQGARGVGLGDGDGGGLARDDKSLLQGVTFYVKSTRRFFNSYWSKLAKQQRERTRRMAAANTVLFKDKGEDKEKNEGLLLGGGRRVDGKSPLGAPMDHERQSPWLLGAPPPLVAEERNSELEMTDLETGDGDGDDEAVRLVPATEAGDGTGGGERSEGRPLRRGDRVMVTTGDLTRLVADEQQRAGEASAQEERDRATGPRVSKANYRVSMRPSRSESWSAKQQQMAISKSRFDQWKREEWADRSFKVLGVEIGHLPASQQFLVCAGGVFSFLIVYGYMQEYLVVGIFNRKLGLFLTLLQFFGYAACAALQRVMHGHKERKIPLITYCGLGFLQACMQGLTNMSMMYLNYPAKVLFKSSRMVPIMCFGVVWQGRKYSKRDYVVVLLIVTGLATFMNAETRASETSETPFSLLGVACISLALVIDAAIINIQEEVMNRYDSCQDELIMYSYICGTTYLVIASLFTGDLQEGVTFLRHKGSKALLAVMLFAGSGYLGVSCVAALTKRFGALHSAITTTARKAFTLLLSFAMFPNKPISAQHAIGAAVFILGLVTKATGKKNPQNLQVGQAASLSPGTTPFIRFRGRKRLSVGKDSFIEDSSSHSAAPLLSGTSGGPSCNGGGHSASGSGGDVDRSQCTSPVDAEGSVGVTGHSGGYPVRHRGYPKNVLNGGDAPGAVDGAGITRGRWGRENGVMDAPQRSPLRRVISPPVSGKGSRIPV